jgi:hypothetical protein
MKKSICYLFICCFANLSFSQWNYVGSSNDIYYTAGLVGVGNATPGFQLDVKSISATSSGTHAGIWSYLEHTAATTGNLTGIASLTKATHTSGTIPLSIGVGGSLYSSSSGSITSM